MKHVSSFMVAVAVLCTSGLVTPTESDAAIEQVNNIVLVPYGNSSGESPAAFAVSYTALPYHTPFTSDPCSSIVYIAPEDRQLFAVALSAQTAGIKVNIKFDNDAPVVMTYPSDSGWSGTNLHCKLLSIWQVKTGY